MAWEKAEDFLSNLQTEKKKHRGFGVTPGVADPKNLPKAHRPGFIYFIAEKDEDGGDISIKIGYSSKPSRRKRSLQTGNSKKLVTLLTIPGTEAQEKSLHAILSKHRIRGELFNPHAEVYQVLCWCEQMGMVPPTVRNLKHDIFGETK